MKKVVPRLLIISSQILLGALFLMFTVSEKTDISYKVNSKDIDKLSRFVYNDETNIDENINDNIVEEKKDIFQELVQEQKKEEIVEIIEENKIEEIDKYFMNNEVLSTYNGILTGYGPDCVGCGNFKTNKVSTSSGYHIADIVDGVIQPAFTITYNDNEYGEVRIVAGDSTLPYKTIVRITMPNQDPIIAVVLDRGSTVGFENCRSSKGCLTNFDLLFPTESSAVGKTHNVKFEILRIGG